MFAEKLRAARASSGGRLCVALDARLADTPLPHLYADEPLFPFLRDVIAAVQPHVCAFAVNPAYFFAEGAAGLVALERIVRVIPEHIPLIWHAHAHVSQDDAGLIARGAHEQFQASAITLAAGTSAYLRAVIAERMQGGVFVADEGQALTFLDPSGQPSTWFGAAGLDEDAPIVVVGRPVLYASKRMDFAEAAADAASVWRDRLNEAGV